MKEGKVAAPTGAYVRDDHGDGCMCMNCTRYAALRPMWNDMVTDQQRTWAPMLRRHRAAPYSGYPIIVPINPTYAFPTAFCSWGPEEHQAIARVIASDRFTMGAETEAFEAELAAYHGVKHAVCVNSGSSANLIAIAALFHEKHNPLQRGDKVVVPAFAWATTWAPLMQMGLDIVLADAGEDWNAIPPAAFTPGVKLVVLTHMLGTPANFTAWQDFARVHGARLIEDNCESIGATVGGRKTGTIGKMGTLSFYWSHQLSAIEGGAIITDDDKCARLCRLLRNHGWTKERRAYDSLNDEIEFVLPGYNVRPVEMHSAIGRVQLRKLDENRGQRVRNWVAWKAAANQHGFPTPRWDVGSNPFGLTCSLPYNGVRQRVAQALRANGIDCRAPAGGSLRLQPLGQPYVDQATPWADRIHTRGLMIGCPPWPARDWIDSAARIIAEAI